jgi:hypothetical protein
MFSQFDIMLKNCNGLYMLKGYGHTLPRIIINKELMRTAHDAGKIEFWLIYIYIFGCVLCFDRQKVSALRAAGRL